MKTELIALRRIGSTPKGGRLRAAPHEARALLALGYAKVPEPEAPALEPAKPAAASSSRRQYRRRDLEAEAPPAPLAPDPIVFGTIRNPDGEEISGAADKPSDEE